MVQVGERWRYKTLRSGVVINMPVVHVLTMKWVKETSENVDGKQYGGWDAV